jgi:hypothetical protein
MPMIPIDSIELPEFFVKLCDDWAGGPGCMLRAVSSYGNLRIATLRPGGCNSDEKRYLALWRSFSADVHSKVCDAKAFGRYYDSTGNAGLAALQGYIDWQVARLEESYGLSDWDN